MSPANFDFLIAQVHHCFFFTFDWDLLSQFSGDLNQLEVTNGYSIAIAHGFITYHSGPN
jgi:hypothetical protein